MINTFGHLIGNTEKRGKAWLDVIDPAQSGVVIGRVASGNSEDAAEAVTAAETAFKEWSQTDAEERGQILEGIAETVMSSADEIADVLVAEQGMLREVSLAEVRLAAREVRNTVERGLPLLRPKVEETSHSYTVVRARPYGVVAGIVPWNAPIVLTMTFLAPALLAGNTVVVKPSELAPLGVNMALRRIAGLMNPGVMNIVNGGASVSQALVASEKVRMVSFTGGVATARHVMAACASTLKDVQLELGGNDAAIILEDTDLQTAVPALVEAVFRRAGQVCFAVKRIYVAEAIYSRFVEAFCVEVDKIRVGHPNTPGTTMGPVISADKVEHIRALVAAARARGAEVLELGQYAEVEPSAGHFLKPHVVVNCSDDMEIVKDEQFGPAIPILSFRDDDEAIRRANSTDFGLSGSVWSRDIERARRIAEQLECGRSYINAHRGTDHGHLVMPFGGVKRSGIGWSNGAYGVAAFTQYHSIDHAKPQEQHP